MQKYSSYLLFKSEFSLWIFDKRSVVAAFCSVKTSTVFCNSSTYEKFASSILFQSTFHELFLVIFDRFLQKDESVVEESFVLTNV